MPPRGRVPSRPPSIDLVGVVIEELQQVPGIAENDYARLYQFGRHRESRLIQAGVVPVLIQVYPQSPGELRDIQSANVFGVDRVGLLLVEARRIELTSRTSNAPTISSSVNRSWSSAIDQPSNAR